MKNKFETTQEQNSILDAEGDFVVNAYAGSGKCLGKDTPVLMYDGSVKKVQEIRKGDLLMGPDSLHRTVLQTNTGRGELFKITPVKGDIWICNDVHVMTLRSTRGNNPEIIDIPLNEFITSKGNSKRPDSEWKLFRTSVVFNNSNNDLSVDPYLVGVWLGDGSISGPRISTPDKEIHTYLEKIAPKYDVTAKISYSSNRCPYVSLTRDNHAKGKRTNNKLRDFFTKRCVIDNEKRIPQNYLTSNRENRLSLLAGMIDTDGHYSGRCYEIITKYKKMSEQILFLCRSLGFAAYSSIKIGRIKSIDFEGTYYRIIISGEMDVIPCILPRKKAKKRKQIKNVLNTGWSAKSVGVGDYYGFTLDKDGRFLLGDFTVTHNTTTIVLYSEKYKEKSQLYLAFNKSVQIEASQKFAHLKNVTVKTAHALAFNAIQVSKNYTLQKFPLNPFEVCQMYKTKVTNSNLIIAQHALKLLGLYCHSSKLKIDDLDYKQYVKDSPAESLFSDQTVDVEIIETGGNTPKLALEKVYSTANSIWNDMDSKKIDISHDFYIKKYHLSNPVLNYDIIYFDEGQDADEAMLDIFLKQKGQKIIVGDDFQAIYGWRNAVNSLGKVDFPRYYLTASFRFGKHMADIANSNLSLRESIPGAKTLENKPALEGLGKGIDTGEVAFIARTNGKLIDEAVQILLQYPEATFFFEGGAKSYPFTSDNSIIFDLLELRANNKKGIRRPFIRQFKDYASLIEYAESTEDAELNVATQIIERYGEKLRIYIPQIVSRACDDKQLADVILTTTHRAKGMEYGSVTLADDFITLETIQKQIMIEDVTPALVASLCEEINILYVAATRAIHKLTYVDPDTTEYITATHDDSDAKVTLSPAGLTKQKLAEKKVETEKIVTKKEEAVKELSSDEGWKQTMSFGKLKGIPLAEAVAKDPKYIIWAMENGLDRKYKELGWLAQQDNWRDLL